MAFVCNWGDPLNWRLIELNTLDHDLTHLVCLKRREGVHAIHINVCQVRAQGLIVTLHHGQAEELVVCSALRKDNAKVGRCDLEVWHLLRTKRSWSHLLIEIVHLLLLSLGAMSIYLITGEASLGFLRLEKIFQLGQIATWLARAHANRTRLAHF